MSKVCKECNGSGRIPTGFGWTRLCKACSGIGYVAVGVTVVGSPHDQHGGDIVSGVSQFSERLLDGSQET